MHPNINVATTLILFDYLHNYFKKRNCHNMLKLHYNDGGYPHITADRYDFKAVSDINDGAVRVRSYYCIDCYNGHICVDRKHVQDLSEPDAFSKFASAILNQLRYGTYNLSADKLFRFLKKKNIKMIYDGSTLIIPTYNNVLVIFSSRELPDGKFAEICSMIAPRVVNPSAEEYDQLADYGTFKEIDFTSKRWTYDVMAFLALARHVHKLDADKRRQSEDIGWPVGRPE